jgi:LmbE family N-acetylglucosaminyl deacetylase
MAHDDTESVTAPARRVVVSPHLDDAAFSASVEIGRGGAAVLSVFAALPPPECPPSAWDLLTGSKDARTRQLERREEDRHALGLLGARGIHLDELENLYRDGDPDLGAAIDLMAAHFADADEVWLPAAIGGHPDHRLARDAALKAAARAGHAEVVFYADFPYVLRFGWPAGAVGRERDPYLDSDAWLVYALHEVGLDPGSLKLAVTRLDADQRARKAEVIGAYRTQASALRISPRDLAADPGKLDFELSWRAQVVAAG